MRNPIVKFFAATFLAAVSLTPVCSAQAELAGDWTGTLAAGGQNFRIAWHVTKAADGSVTSTFDNVDEGILGIKVKTMALKGSDFTLAVDDQMQASGGTVHIAGSFKGVLSKDGNGVTGTWTQTDPQPDSSDLTLKRVEAASQSVPSQQIAGDWKGTLSAGGAELHLVFHFVAAKDGALSGNLDSVDQGANGIPVTAVTLIGSKLSLTVDSVHGTFEGTVNADASAIAGTWSQGTPLELNLTRAGAPAPSK